MLHRCAYAVMHAPFVIFFNIRKSGGFPICSNVKGEPDITRVKCTGFSAGSDKRVYGGCTHSLLRAAHSVLTSPTQITLLAHHRALTQLQKSDEALVVVDAITVEVGGTTVLATN